MKCLDNFEVSQARPMDKLFRDGGLKSQTQAWRKLENSEGPLGPSEARPVPSVIHGGEAPEIILDFHVKMVLM